MLIDHIVLVGSGGQALVVLDSLAALGVPPNVITLLDENPGRVGAIVGGQTVQIFDIEELSGRSVHICIGDNHARESVAERLLAARCRLRTIIDPRAIVSKQARVGEGSFIAAGAIVATQASIGRGCIINHGAIVDHECRLLDFVHIAPGATLAGAVTVGAGVLVGAGANVLPKISITANSTIGAGAVLTADADDRAVYVGVPARKVVNHAKSP